MGDFKNHDGIEGLYSVRLGAAAYAQIVGVFGSLSVPAIVVLFTVNHSGGGKTGHTLVTLAVALLVIGMLGSLAGAIGLAAVGAETAPTANLAPAVMFVAVPVAVAIGSMLGAFDVLDCLYLQGVGHFFFIALVAFGGFFAVMFLTFAIADSIGLGPQNQSDYLAWFDRVKPWINSRRQGFKWASALASGGAILLAATFIIGRPLMDPIRTGSEGATIWILAIAGLLFMCGALLYGQACTVHRPEQRPLKPSQAILSSTMVVVFFGLLVVLLP